MATHERTRGRRLGRLSRFSWLLVLLMMLAAAAWSISSKLTEWGMSTWLAYALSLMFDAAGLLCADYARRAVERGTAAGLPRLAILGFVSISGAVNWSHGQEVGGNVAAVGLASISAAVEILFELHRRDVRDEQRAARGLVAERLPYIPLAGWVMYPARSFRTLRAAVGARLDALGPDPVDAPQTGAAEVKPTPSAAPSVTYSDPRCQIIRALYDAGTRPRTGSMRAALVAAGYVPPPADSVIRGQLRADVERWEPHLADLPPEALPLRKTAP
jgi:hypothetical protein